MNHRSYLMNIDMTNNQQPKAIISNTIDDSLENYIIKTISQLPKVEQVKVSKIGNFYEVWTVINKLDRKVRQQIYNMEYSIMEKFRDIDFDFHVITRNNRNIKDLITFN